MSLKVAICDDNMNMASNIEVLLTAFNNQLFEVEVFTQPLRLLASLKTISYDLYILDMEMPELSGIDLAERIRAINVSCPIIFVTSYREYMDKAFKVNSFDYIVKPITKEAFFPALQRVLNYLQPNETRFAFTFNKSLYSLKMSDIIYFEKNKRSVSIHTSTERHSSIMDTQTLLSKLDASFVQIHQSYIVNISHITKISSHTVTLSMKTNTAIALPISRTYSEHARQMIMKKLRELI